jgi:hypothetical protein
VHNPIGKQLRSADFFSLPNEGRRGAETSRKRCGNGSKTAVIILVLILILFLKPALLIRWGCELGSLWKIGRWFEDEDEDEDEDDRLAWPFVIRP